METVETVEIVVEEEDMEEIAGVEDEEVIEHSTEEIEALTEGVLDSQDLRLQLVVIRSTEFPV